MKKILALGVAIAMVAAFIPAVSGETTQTINVTMNPSTTASIIVNESYLNATGLGISNTTACNIENDGSVNCTVEIKAANTTDWTLVSSDPTTDGLDEFALDYVIDGGSNTYITDANATFISDFGHDGSTNFNLSVYMPEFTSTNNEQTTTITFTATAL
jgi:hypothetical protein